MSVNGQVVEREGWREKEGESSGLYREGREGGRDLPTRQLEEAAVGWQGFPGHFFPRGTSSSFPTLWRPSSPFGQLSLLLLLLSPYLSLSFWPPFWGLSSFPIHTEVPALLRLASRGNGHALHD